MTKGILFLLMTLAAPAFATSGIVEVVGSLVNHHADCTQSPYGYMLDGAYKDESGKPHPVHTCLQTIALPLEASDCLVPANRTDVYQAALQTLTTASAKTDLVLKTALEDMEDPVQGRITLLSLRSSCTR